jgi:hypothetical protein
MRHIIELETSDLDELFHEGFKFPAGENVTLKARFTDMPRAFIGDLSDDTDHARLPLVEKLPEDLPVDLPRLKFRCDHPGCETSYAVLGHLNNHRLNKHGIARKSSARGDYYCEEHQKPFLNHRGLDAHNRIKHRSGGTGYKFECTDDDCVLTFPTPSSRDNHMRKAHGD